MSQYKYSQGRTMHEAIKAQDSYAVDADGFASPFWCPGTCGIDESILAFKSNFPNIHGDFKLLRVLKGSQIGCMIYEESTTITF
jgi:hypothetical protein